MRMFVAGIFVAFVLLTGCAGTSFEWDTARKIEPGMTEQEVTALMGAPNMVKASNEGNIWVWTHVNMMVGETRSLSVVFKDGKVSGKPKIPESFK